MELILKKDVENLGFTDDIVTVKNGYGRNFLLPQGLAVLATPSTKKVLAETLKQRAFKEKKIIEDAQKEADKLNGLEIKIASKSGEGNKLFGSVSNANLANALRTMVWQLIKNSLQLQVASLSVPANTTQKYVSTETLCLIYLLKLVAEKKQ